MKKNLLLLATALTMSVGANAQNASNLNWDREISQEQLNAAFETLSPILGTSVSAQYVLRGGKENGIPESHAYQYHYGLNTDNYAGYMVVPHYDFPYANANLRSTYAMDEAFNGGAHGVYEAKNILIPLLRQSAINDIPELKAVNLLYYCVAAQQNADVSGPFTYIEDKQGSENPAVYNDLKTIYYGIVADLDNIVACLKNFENRPDWYKARVNQEFETYQTGRYAIANDPDSYSFAESAWRLANSLKLRMAMRIVKVEPETAQRWAEEAVASGVCEDEDMQQGVYPSVTGFDNPLVTICNTWNDNRLNASFETIMMQLDHPYAKYFWKKNTMPIENKVTGDVLPRDTRILGIRAGAHCGEGQVAASNQYISSSTFDDAAGLIQNAPLYFVKWAEVDFLRAEGALRGWNMGGTAQEFYERGIQNASFEEPSDVFINQLFGNDVYANYVDEYMQLEEAIPYTQVDAFGDGEDWVSPITIGVKWNDADDDETKLEKIITQKWLALWPLSSEAWAELRRTGYPRLIPVLNPQDGDGSLKEGDLIRRMPWASTDAQTIANIEATGLAALGGPDLQATRLWWDVANKDNFGNTIGGDDDAIQSVDATVVDAADIYDLSGRKTNSIKSGLYIRGGKKMVF